MAEFSIENRINVCTCFDQNLIVAGIVLVQSIIENSVASHPVHISIITSDTNFDHTAYFQPIAHVAIETIHIDNDYMDFPDKDYITSGTYLRFSIPRVLSRFQRVLYLDADIVVNRDLYEVYNLDMHAKPLAAMSDYALTLGSLTWTDWYVSYKHKKYSFSDYALKVLGIDVQERGEYFNCGVLLIDIEKWQSMKIVEKATAFLRECPNICYLDQDALSHVISGNFVRLDPRWNAFSDQAYPDQRWWAQRLLGRQSKYDDVRQAWRGDPWIIHFAGQRKPWDANADVTPLDHLWWGYARTSPAWPRLTDLESVKFSRKRYPPVRYPSDFRKGKGA